MITIKKREQIIKSPRREESFFHSDTGITSISHSSEIGEALRDLNRDELDHTKMSSIDMRANLHVIEANGLLCMDTLVALRVIPKSCLSFTRQKKRLSVSTRSDQRVGIGRTQTVDIVTGKKQEDKPVLGSLDKLRGVFGGHEKQ